MTNYILLGRKIKKFRLKMKLSQEQLAEKCNLSTSYISYIENGKKMLSFSQLDKLSKVLNFSIDIYQNSTNKKARTIKKLFLLKFLSNFSIQEKIFFYKLVCLIKSELELNQFDSLSQL